MSGAASVSVSVSVSASASASASATEARARPLSGGLWSLLSWLRRDEDSAASSDSLSSVGSDRTVASFAFLAPDRYRHLAAPVLLPPPGPPTDSYKRRLRDRNSRLQHDRDLTLHRKYGLFRGENNGYDAFSLPPSRKLSENKDREDRDRRAASEGLQRRAAYVPGKRRAPAPPAPAPAPAPASAPAPAPAPPRAATLDAPRRARKRPAPQPPRRPLSVLCRNAPIPEEPLQAQIGRVDPPLRRTETMDYKPEKSVKKDPKPRTEKSFLKQIFESRKRNSVVDPVPERILPSISELDKQAAEIIHSCKLKALDRSDERTAGTSRELVTSSRGDMWFCTRCLRKYNDSVVTCGHCVTEQKMKLNKKTSGSGRYASRPSNPCTQTEEANILSTSRVNEVEEKQKLKEMLKEIKDSLPKRPKHDVNENKNANNSASTNERPSVVEAPTLRIGSKIPDEEKLIQSSNSKLTNGEAESKLNDVKVVLNTRLTSATETAVVTQPIVLQHIPSRDTITLDHFNITNLTQDKASIHLNVALSDKKFTSSSNKKESVIPNKIKHDSEPSTSTKGHLNIPLKISSLLNPLPMNLSQSGNQQQQKTNNQTTTSSSDAKPLVSSSNLPANTTLNTGFHVSLPASPTAASKVPKTSLTPQEHKVLKATSTTQTSSNIFLDNSGKFKQNTASILDQANYNKPTNFEVELARKKTSPELTSRSVLSEVQTSSTAPGPHLDNNEKNGNQVKKPLLDNARCEVSGEVPKLDFPRASDHHQRDPAAKSIPIDLHSRRRDLINQLEQSIAKGDERAAADAAAKLAQLRLSCSVLSFSSQIVGAPSTSSTGPVNTTNEPVFNEVQREDKVTKTNKLLTQTKSPDRLQKTSSDYVVASSSKTSIEKKTIPTQPQSGEMKKKIFANNTQQTIIEPSTSKINEAAGNENVSIEVWIEDREAARGPIRMNLLRASVMGDLRRQANTSFGLAAHLQRWIVGRTLCTDDNTPLNSLAGPKFDAPFYLCLVEPETNKHTASTSTPNNKTEDKKQNIDQTNGENKTTDVYAELVLLEQRALVPNAEEFECGVCMEQYKPGQGAVLRECVHTFCKECLSDVVKHSEEPAVSCPAMGCPGFLHEREIRALVSPEEYERWLARGLAAAESGTRNAFHCRTRDCQGWALCEPGVTRFPCPVCKRTNCVSCQAIHEGDTCEQYRAKQRESEAASRAPEETDEGTRAFLDTLISRGEALECPECSAIITKKWGCDWIKCSACKTEICWVTRGRRWGPGGRGDTSAGCRCGVDGKRCHPSCGYCH